MEKLEEFLPGPPRIGRRIAAGVGAVVLAGVYAGVGMYGSSEMLRVTPQQVKYDQSVVAVEGDYITTQGGAYNIDGLVGGIRPDGSTMGIFGPPVTLDAESQTSTRLLQEPKGNAPKAGEHLSLQGNIWTSNPKEALGLDYEEIKYDSELGKMGGWKIPSNDSKTWVIGVHGDGAPKSEMLRFIKPLHEAGNNFLAINYRNDPGNPASPDGLKHLGDTEWKDLQAAVRYAKQQGAEDIHLFGVSIGGSIVENYLRRAPKEGVMRIGKVMLDSPVLDWDNFVKYRLKSQGYPSILAIPGKTIAYLRTGMGLSLDNISTSANDIRHPTLIIHGSDDRTVPSGPSKRLAEARPDMITYYDSPGGHARAVNKNPQLVGRLMTDFIRK